MKTLLWHLAPRLQRFAGLLPLLPRTLRLVWDASHGWSTAAAFLLLLQGLLPAAMVHLTKALVDSLVLVVDAGRSSETIGVALRLAFGMGLLVLFEQVLRGLTIWVRTAQGELIQDHLRDLVHAKSTEVDLAFYDLPEYFDHLHRARTDAGYRPLALLESTGSLLQNSITLIAMLFVLAPYGLWLLPVLVASTLPAVAVVLHYTMRQYAFRMRTTAEERRSWYYDWLLTARETAAELRLFLLGGHFRQAYHALRKGLREERLRLVRSQAAAELAASLTSVATIGAVVIGFIWQGIRGGHDAASLGDVALLYAALSRGMGLARSLLENFGQIYSNSLFVNDLFTFLSLKPQVIDPEAARRASGDAGARAVPLPALAGAEPQNAAIALSFVGVTFHYPGSSRPILQDFHLHIPAGQVAAIVGSNGAGKSTLVKLLCRFYDPDAGRIEVNGVDLRTLSLAAWRRQITVLFQSPVQYNTTLAENIRLGDLAAQPSQEMVQNAAVGAGADQVAARLPLGYDTALGVWFSGGVDLSVGEWQRVALARAYLRQAPVIILDEPTSALDPWAEADWLERFRRLPGPHTAILITHRLTTACHADVIHVMEEGRIIESGSHEELLRQQGRYAQSWHARTQNLMVPSAPAEQRG